MGPGQRPSRGNRQDKGPGVSSGTARTPGRWDGGAEGERGGKVSRESRWRPVSVPSGASGSTGVLSCFSQLVGAPGVSWLVASSRPPPPLCPTAFYSCVSFCHQI